MRRASVLGAAASLCLVFGAAACGGDDEARARRTSSTSCPRSLQAGGDGVRRGDGRLLRARSSSTRSASRTLQDVDLSADEPPEELQDEIAAATIRATEECDLAGTGG